MFNLELRPSIRQFEVEVHSHCPHGVVFSQSRQLFSEAQKDAGLHLLSTSRQTHLVGTVEHLTDKETDITSGTKKNIAKIYIC